MTPFFSVIIPTYNREKELKRSIQSVLAQSFSNLEVLVMDDGSNDYTESMVRSLDDSRITYDWDENFGGPAKPRNRGIAKAQGEWICFLDADDWWADNKLEICHQHINEQVDVIYHDLEIVGVPARLFRSKIIKSRQLKTPVLIDLLVGGNAIANSSAVVRKKLLDEIGRIDERKEMIASEDYNTWLRLAKVSERFLYIPKPLGFYLVHEKNISHRDMSLNWEYSCSNFMSYLSQVQQNKLKAEICYMRGRFAFTKNDYLRAIASLKFCLWYGGPIKKIKSLYMIVVIKLKRKFKE